MSTKRMQLFVTSNIIYKINSLLSVTSDSAGLPDMHTVVSTESELLSCAAWGWPFFALEGGVTPTRSISQSGDQSNSSDMGHTGESALPRLLPHSGLLHLWEGEPQTCQLLASTQIPKLQHQKSEETGIAISPWGLSFCGQMSVLMEERCRRDEAMQCKAGKSQQSQARFGGKEKEN